VVLAVNDCGVAKVKVVLAKVVGRGRVGLVKVVIRVSGVPREHLTFVTPKSGFMSSYFESLARNQF
jgi:hypothetical protein